MAETADPKEEPKAEPKAEPPKEQPWEKPFQDLKKEVTDALATLKAKPAKAADEPPPKAAPEKVEPPKAEEPPPKAPTKDEPAPKRPRSLPHKLLFG